MSLDQPLIALDARPRHRRYRPVARADQTVIIREGTIATLGPTSTVDIPRGAHVLDLHRPHRAAGLVGMHEHLFYQLHAPASQPTMLQAQAAFAKLYLAAGVTTIRTAGTGDLAGDLRIKRLIDAGREPGPTIHVSGPYLHALGKTPSPDEIARQVNAAADKGATSFKAYTTLRAAELKAAIDAAHARGLVVTGHLCAVGYREAAELGIDNIEHGLVFDTEFYSGKQPDQCPNQSAVWGELLGMDVTHSEIQRLISDLVRRRVFVTSTLAVIESFTARRDVIDPQVPTLLSWRLRKAYHAAHEAWSDPDSDASRGWQRLLRKEMQFERAFVAAGGRLIAGVDPTGWGGVIAGTGDLRQLELLVEAGLSAEAAIEIATSNGASLLGDSDIGTLATGKRADLLIVRGDPAATISDVRNVEMVFKHGVGYDPARLIAATLGTLGGIEFARLLRWPLNALVAVGLFLFAGLAVSRRSRSAAREGVS